jgi:hypothetical protein
MKIILAAAVLSTILMSPTLAQNNQGGNSQGGNNQGGNNQGGNGHGHPAPGPIVGAGLPFLAVGYGVYWLVRRNRRKIVGES